MAAPSGIEIGRLEPGDIRRAVLLLAQAMRDNPTHVKAFGGADREQRLCRFLAVMVDHVRTNGLLFGAWAEGRLVGVAGTLRPGACRPSLPDRISLALAILRRMPPLTALHADDLFLGCVANVSSISISEHRDLPAAKRFLCKALANHGSPERIIIDGSQTNREAIIAIDTENRLQVNARGALKRIRIRSSKYLNNRIEQDHRRIKRRTRPMLGFKSFASANATLASIEMVHMMRKRQGRFAFNPALTIKEQFEAIVA